MNQRQENAPESKLPPDGAADKQAGARLIADAVKSLTPRFKQHAAETDRNRAIPRAHYDAMRDARLFDILKPRKFGGLELSAHEHAMAAMEIAEACASTAWVFSILSADNVIITEYSEEVQDEIWGANRHATLAGSIFLNSRSRAASVDGGYRLSGRWGFNSGSDFADWLVLTATVDDDDLPHTFLIPTHEVSIVDDWFPTGMRGTGSRTVVADNLFVPERRVMQARTRGTGSRSGVAEAPERVIFAQEDRKALHPTFDALHAPSGGYGKFAFSAVAVGAALGAVNHFIETAAGSTRVATALGGALRLIDQDYVAAEFAEAAADIQMARLLVEQSSKRVAEQCRLREPITRLDLARDFRDSAYVTKIAVRTVQTISSLLGAKTGFPEHPVSRAKRDVEMISHHVTLNWRQAAVDYTSAACEPESDLDRGTLRVR